MILARASRYCLAILIAITATGAHADVMEVSGDRARWVAGGPALPTANAGNHVPSDALVELNTAHVPDMIVASVAANASQIPPQYTAKINELAQRFDLSPALLEALVWQESRWRPNAISHAGARGLAQLMPGTARYLGVDPDDPMQNLEGGARYLREQLDRFDGDLEKALAAYNAGPGRVIRAGGIPNIRETKHYVAAIMGRLANHSRPIGE